MGKAFIQEETLINIANAIRQKNLSDIKYKPTEMPAAILALTSFSDEQKQAIIDALATKGVNVKLEELTLDNISTYILQIKIDSNKEQYIPLRNEYNESIKYSQKQLNSLNSTSLSYNEYPEFDDNVDSASQFNALTAALSELKEYISTNLTDLNS